MSRHSKNNTAHSIFTYGQRTAVTEWGTQKQRLGQDSLKPFKSCSLCLQTMVEPVSCTKGHLFCRECIFTNVSEQRKKIKSIRKIQRKTLSKKKEEIEEKSLVVQNYQKFVENKNYGLMNPQQKKLAKIRDQIVNKRVPKASLTQSSFWVPELTPFAEQTKQEKKKVECPAGSHLLKLKKLIRIVLSNGQFVCIDCNKEISNQACIAFEKCGHISCKKCVIQPVCSVCGTGSKKVRLQKGGSMFSQHNRVEAVKIRSVFQS